MEVYDEGHVAFDGINKYLICAKILDLSTLET